MQIEVIEFEFGMTQNLGDYSNTRPSLKLVARLAEGDDPYEEIADLTRTAINKVHAIVDDELEQAGRKVKYTFEQLYQVRSSEIRQCVIIFPDGTKLPEERTWRDKDYWHRPGVDREHPDRMRIQLAQAIAMLSRQGHLELIYCTDGDMSHIPPLPDPGPEPAWHAKKLEQAFRNLRLNEEAVWAELGELEHVTVSYLQGLYDKDAERKLTSEELVALIRSGQPFGETAPEPEDEEEDEYQEDYDDDDDEAPF